MAYVITNSRGSVIATIESGEDNTSATSITLLGPNYPAYGLPQNENFVYMLENFASNTAPSNPISGQLWFDTSTNTLYQRNTSADWTALANNAYVQAQKISPVFTGNPTAPTTAVTNISNTLATTSFVANYVEYINPAPLNSPFFTGTPLAPTASNGVANNQVATTLFVSNLFNNVDTSPYAVKNNTVLTGLTSAPTPVLAARDSQIATTAFVRNVFENPDFSPYAPKVSPVLTGIPQVPTASPATSTNQIASTAFVQGLFANVDLSLYAPKASPVLTGTPTAPTPTSSDSSTRIATTAFVQAQKTSPEFTGVPTAPTAASGTNTTQIATTAFVQTAVAAIAPAASVGAELAGSIKMWGSATPPDNWAICNGQALSRTAYPTLFSRIGTTYGAGDGSTTFNLPDFRNRFPVGAGNTYNGGATGGFADAAVITHTHTGSTNTVANHQHSHVDRYFPVVASLANQTYVTSKEQMPSSPPYNGYLGEGSADRDNNFWLTYNDSTGAAGSHNHTITINAPDGSVSGTGRNLPPYLAGWWIIKLSDDGSGGGTLQAGTGIDLTTSGAYTTIRNSGVTSINGQSGAITIPTSTNLIAGQGIAISTVAGNTTITNTQALAPVVAGNGISVTNTAGGALVSANVVSVTAAQGAGINAVTTNGSVVLSLATPNGVFTKSYESEEIAYPSANNIIHAEFDHELGETPKLIQAVLVCKTAQSGYQPGDEIAWCNDYCPGYYLVQMAGNSSKVYLNVGGLVLIVNRNTSGGGGAAITKANWRWKIKAWA